MVDITQVVFQLALLASIGGMVYLALRGGE